VLRSLQQIYTADRVRDLNLKIEMDQSKKTVQSDEFYPITIKPRTPGSPYDDSQLVSSITRSRTTTDYSWQGTGYTPEGPAGVEGQTAPAYKDMSDLAGKVQQTSTVNNEEINNRKIVEEKSPQIDRVSVSVNIDGTWKTKYDAKTGRALANPDGSVQREYVPLSDDELKKATALIQDAIGYDKSRGDSVTVQNIPFDRSEEFAQLDLQFIKQQQLNQIILYSLMGLAGILVAFIIFRLISRELERRRRSREEELSRQHQLMRENALRQAEEEGVEVSMSVEERKRLEMQDTAINMAREHPEDVAQLIRTWLVEE
jgi:flagellar M-ring protein FliF